jgi:hypothetical protein
VSPYTANGRSNVVASKNIAESYANNDSDNEEQDHKDHEHGGGYGDDTAMIRACDQLELV